MKRRRELRVWRMRKQDDDVADEQTSRQNRRHECQSGNHTAGKGPKGHGRDQSATDRRDADPSSFANRPSAVERLPHVSDKQDENHEVKGEQWDQAHPQGCNRSFLLEDPSQTEQKGGSEQRSGTRHVTTQPAGFPATRVASWC